MQLKLADLAEQAISLAKLECINTSMHHHISASLYQYMLGSHMTRSHVKHCANEVHGALI